jgi:hypothetical protein
MGTQGAERPPRLSTIGEPGAGSCWSDTDLTPALLSIRRASSWWPGVPGAHPLIRKVVFMDQSWCEAGLREDFA